MSYFLNLVLKTELTGIPRLLNKYLGNYYNNALCNGSFWLFIFWCLLHVTFDKFLNAFLRKLRYKEYIRKRLTSSLWYLGFYSTAFLYCVAVLLKSELDGFNIKNANEDLHSFPAQLLGYTLISTFYFHTAAWEGLKNASFISMSSYALIAVIFVISYIIRILNIAFMLTTLFSCAQIIIEFTKCLVIFSDFETFLKRIFIGFLFGLSILIYFMAVFLLIPAFCMIPMGSKILFSVPQNNVLYSTLFVLILLWCININYNSIVLKCIYHVLYHNKDAESKLSCNGIIECSLFAPRDDVSYNLYLLRQEIKAREAEMMSMRKPKNRGMLVQTLKCMVAIKRKLNKKRLPQENSDSDDSDENNEAETSVETKRTTVLEKLDDHDNIPLIDADESMDDIDRSLNIELEEASCSDVSADRAQKKEESNL